MSRITIEYTAAFQQGAGIGRLVREQVAALAQLDTQTAFRLFVAGTPKFALPDACGANFQARSTPISVAWLARLWHRLRAPLPVETFAGHTDCYHATDFTLPPTLPSTKTILTVHDLSFVRVPESASPRLRAYLNAVVPRSVTRASHIIADSQATKEDLIALYCVPHDKITVVLSGVSPFMHRIQDPLQKARVRTKYHIPARPYLLSVGTVQPRKNYSRAIQVLAILRQYGYDVGLVIAGGQGWLQDEMYQTIQQTQMTEFVHLIGFADDVDLPTLYSDAAAVLYPSLYEGFGFPILEAMACGTPVVAANTSSLPEVAGDAALLVDPYSIEAILFATQQLLDDQSLRQRLITAGLSRVKQFTWQNSAKALQQVYQHVLAS